ncbi:unnamed protein product [Musa textilis]
MIGVFLIFYGAIMTVSSTCILHVAQAWSTDSLEISALRIIRGSLIDNMNSLKSWSNGDPCTSNWTGIICYAAPNDEYLHIRELQLLKLNLSGTLAPELGLLSHLEILDFMWNGINGTIPKEIGNITSLRLLLLNGNHISGSLPDEIGNLYNLNRLQIDLNQISGPIPKSFANLSKIKHLHMNNNSLSGQIPPELSRLPILYHFLVDNNNFSGYLPPELASFAMPENPFLNSRICFLTHRSSHDDETFPWKSRIFVFFSSAVHVKSPLDFPTKKSYRLLVHAGREEASAALRGEETEHRRGGVSSPHIARRNKAAMSPRRPFLHGEKETSVSSPHVGRNQATSLRNCSLQGTIPDLSQIPRLGYLDLSWNQLKGPLPSKLSIDITTIDLSHNYLNGTIPLTFSGLPKLQKLSLANNLLTGSVPSSIWQNMTFNTNATLLLDFQNNSLTDISDYYTPPANVTILLYGNPVCDSENQPEIVHFCQLKTISQASRNSIKSKIMCSRCPVDKDYERNPLSPMQCLCAVPLGVGFRLKSPGISDFRSYINDFEINLTSLLHLFVYQLYIDSFIWESGPRLNMQLKLFPSNVSVFNVSEILRLRDMLAAWDITLSDVFGPYELLNFTLGSYASDIPATSESGLSKNAMVGILVGAVAGAIAVSVAVTVLVMRRYRDHRAISRKRSSLRTSIKINDVKCFTFEDMVRATNNFSSSMQVGQGGYGKVYRGTLVDGTPVAIKRAQEGSFQGSKEFSTEIELLSRLHHRNLVSLVGYCNEQDEQMLVYEFMPNGTLRDHLSAKCKEPPSFSKRLHIALGSARGILYLHSEANPPIFHRDIKASNILLDFKFVAKVADFGLSRLAPGPGIEGIIPGHISTVVKGTPGYLDPEYLLTHKLTDRSDVYSLGVVFLELLTGMRPISHGKNIVREVKTACQCGSMLSIIDSRMNTYPLECTEKFLSLALGCCHDETDARPSMSEVVRELENILHMMPEDATSEAPVTDSSKIVSVSFVSSESSGADHLVSSGIPAVSAR